MFFFFPFLSYQDLLKQFASTQVRECVLSLLYFITCCATASSPVLSVNAAKIPHHTHLLVLVFIHQQYDEPALPQWCSSSFIMFAVFLRNMQEINTPQHFLAGLTKPCFVLMYKPLTGSFVVVCFLHTASYCLPLLPPFLLPLWLNSNVIYCRHKSAVNICVTWINKRSWVQLHVDSFSWTAQKFCADLASPRFSHTHTHAPAHTNEQSKWMTTTVLVEIKQLNLSRFPPKITHLLLKAVGKGCPLRWDNAWHRVMRENKQTLFAKISTQWWKKHSSST